jgi:hypothetical protein
MLLLTGCLNKNPSAGGHWGWFEVIILKFEITSEFENLEYQKYEINSNKDFA